MISCIKTVLFCVFILIQIQNIRTDPINPIVSTKLGLIKGVVRTLEDGKTSVNLFNGIRYGKAPVGERRFRKPEAEPKWEGVYEAIKPRHSCPQMLGLGIPVEAPIGEDCLFLSVWQPSEPLPHNKTRSVMMFIHGGSFTSGTEFTIAYDARWLAALGDVIVVTINYRLGAFGFLCANNDEVPGNAGLYDQVMALTWVKDNIEAFGGDPDSITIFGESAGSMSVSSLVLSPLTQGLFKRAIMESGSAITPVMGSDSKEAQLVKFNHFAIKLKCNRSEIMDTITCLRNQTIKDILTVSSHSLVDLELTNPVHGDELLPIRPADALKTGKFNKNIDLMVGTNRDEGSFLIEGVFSELSPDKQINMTVSKAKQYVELIYMVLKQNYSQSVADYYIKDLKDYQTPELLRAISASLGDYVLTCPTLLFGERLAKSDKTSKTYAYRLTHKPAVSALLSCRGWMGVCHADEIVFIYGFPIALRGIPYTEDDYKLSKDLIRVWSTFAKEGSPPPLDGIKWPEAVDRDVADSSVTVMQLNPTNYTVLKDFYKVTCDQFWNPHLQ